VPLAAGNVYAIELLAESLPSDADRASAMTARDNVGLTPLDLLAVTGCGERHVVRRARVCRAGLRDRV
jgi:hypothetical protein